MVLVLHSGIALKHGVDIDELQSLLDRGTFGAVDEREATAVLFAQHFAETRRRPTPRRASPWQAVHPMAAAGDHGLDHFIYFANLSGNSADAWLARLRGWEVADGHPLAEALAGLVAAPVLLLGWLGSRNWRPAALRGL